MRRTVAALFAAAVTAAAAISTTAATAVVSTAAAATASTAVVVLGLSLVYLQRAAVDLFAVEGRNGFLRFGRRGHLDKSKAARAARLAVLDDVCRADRTGCAKKIDQVLIRCVEGNISYIKFC